MNSPDALEREAAISIGRFGVLAAVVGALLGAAIYLLDGASAGPYSLAENVLIGAVGAPIVAALGAVIVFVLTALD